MGETEREGAVLDTSVLINFLAVDRTDLLARHPTYRFLITEHVRAEVTMHYNEQLERLNAALQSGALTEIRVDAIEELSTFAGLMKSGRLGAGECAAIAAAAHRGYALATDDKAARKAALSLLSVDHLLNTQTLVVSLIRGSMISVDEADALKLEWETKHSFALKIRSFRECL